ncbi:protein MAIN-LIKE 2-like [Lathyrus oleraceus]|uniref:protein MAIN-LIKE 2-like n=2 Tax=Pisum sativum TaxID=3888 RepID=UPI0021D02FEE|nr:protein MAIN-LIKE 2-like [Pisum sativum]
MAPPLYYCTWSPNEVETPCKHNFLCSPPFAYKFIHSFNNSSTPTFSLLHLHYFFYNFIFNKIFQFHLHQLPNNMSLLTMGEAHRGTVANIATYDVSRFRTRVHEFVPMDPMIQPYVELAGFGHISKIMSWSIDNKFILALCERWRPETHTFWFPTGECTVTLEDVYMLLGLRIEGKAVNGKTNYANSICMELLDTDLLDDNARGQGILLSRLKSYYNSLYLDEHSTEDARIIKTRCYIMLLLGSFLFPEGSGSSMHIMYLPLLRHIDRIGSYSWGSACLAYLYNGWHVV